MTAPASLTHVRGTLQEATIQAQLIALLYAQARTTNVFVLIIGVATLVFFWKEGPWNWLALWFGLLCLSTFLRLTLINRYYRANPGIDEAPRWGRKYTVVTFIGGALWGAFITGVLLFLPQDPVAAAFIIALFAGYTTAAVPRLASHLPAVYAFILPLGVTLIVGMLSSPDMLHLFFALCGFLFFVNSAVCARNTNRSIVEAVALRFENLQLVEALTEKNQQAEQARQAAEDANTAKSKFLAAASHDLRQPLHALSFLAFALNKQSNSPKAQRIVDSMKLSLDALQALFTALLDVSKLDAGVIRPQIRDFRLQHLVERLRNDFEPEARAKGLNLSIPDLNVVVRSDPQLLERILRNLLSNAIRYTEQGDVLLYAEVTDGTARISIADTGKGIPLDKQQDIFREFYQLGNPERDRTKGLGLGLAIVDRLSRLLGHQIDVNSRPSEGSIFSVSVPLGDAAADSPAACAPEPDTVDVSGMFVLVVDDERNVRESMTELFEVWGCEYVLAGSEEEAVEQLRRVGRAPDVVIADYRLREERTGAQAIRRIHEEYNQNIPALIITGDTAPDRLREAAASGYQLLHKPVLPAQLQLFLRDAKCAHLPRSEAGAEVE